MKLSLIIFLLFVGRESALSYENNFALSAAIGFGQTEFTTSTEKDVSSASAALLTNFGYRWKNLEIDAHSSITAGISGSSFHQQAQGSNIYGRTWYRAMAFGPSIRYNSDLLIVKTWQTFIKVGPQWEILTTARQGTRTVSGGNFTPGHIVKYEGSGFHAAVGIGKKTNRHTEMTFYQITYKFISFDRLSVLDSAGRDTNVIHREKLGYNFEEVSILLSMGWVIF